MFRSTTIVVALFCVVTAGYANKSFGYGENEYTHDSNYIISILPSLAIKCFGGDETSCRQSEAIERMLTEHPIYTGNVSSTPAMIFCEGFGMDTRAHNILLIRSLSINLNQRSVLGV